MMSVRDIISGWLGLFLCLALSTRISSTPCPVISTERGFLQNCSWLGLHSIPTDLQRANVTVLLLDHNDIYQLNQSDLSGFTDLIILELSSNYIDFVHPSAFKQMPNLQVLRMNFNKLPGWPDDALRPLRKLTELGLGEAIGGKLGPPGQGFLSLRQLQKLDISVLEVDNITAEFFAYVPKHSLEELNLGEVTTSGIFSGAFSAFRNLKYLDLSNIIGHLELQSVLSDLNGSALQTLILWGNNDLEQLTPSVFSGFTHNSLKTIVFSYCVNLQNISDGTFRNLKALTSLMLDNCRIESVTSKTFTGLDNLQFLDVSGGYLQDYDFSEGRLENLLILNISYNRNLNHMKSNRFSGLPKLNHMEATNIRVRTVEACAFCGLGNLQSMNFKWVESSHISAAVFHGLYNLTRLDIRNLGLTFLNFTLFQDLNSLVSLTANANELTKVTNDAFVPVANTLKSLSMDSCSLSEVQEMFQVFRKLEELTLNDNNIVFQPETFGRNSTIQHLVISSNNELSDIPHAVKVLPALHYLDIISCNISLISDINFLGNRRLTGFAGSENPYDCSSCALIPFIEWLNTTDKIVDDSYLYQCAKSGDMLVKKLHGLQQQCAPISILIFAVAIPSGILVFALIPALVLYRYRHQLKGWHRRKVLLKHYHPLVDEDDYDENEDDERQYEYDCFVAYNDKDFETFVRDTLLRELDQNHPNNDEQQVQQPESRNEERFKVTGDFDMLPNCVHHEEIQRLVDASRKVLFVLSNNFADDQSMLNTYNIANNKKSDKDIVIVVWQSVGRRRMKALPKTLHERLKKRLYVKWTEHEEGKVIFWELLRLMLRKKRPDRAD